MLLGFTILDMVPALVAIFGKIIGLYYQVIGPNRIFIVG